jgi:hypothetical protein
VNLKSKKRKPYFQASRTQKSELKLKNAEDSGGDEGGTAPWERNNFCQVTCGKLSSS